MGPNSVTSIFKRRGNLDRWGYGDTEKRKPSIRGGERLRTDPHHTLVLRRNQICQCHQNCEKINFCSISQPVCDTAIVASANQYKHQGFPTTLKIETQHLTRDATSSGPWPARAASLFALSLPQGSPAFLLLILAPSCSGL